jgi:hypothetical protein
LTTIFDLKQQFLIGFFSLSVLWGVLILWNQFQTATKVLRVPRTSRHATAEESGSKHSGNGPP